MDCVLDRADAVFLDAAIVAGEQHRPFRQRHEHRIVHLQLDRQFDAFKARGFYVGLQLSQDRGVCVGFEARRLEVGRQPDLQDVDLFFRRAERLGIGAAQRHELRVEAVPDGGIRVALPYFLQRHAGDARQVGQRRDVHDGHAGQFGFGHRLQQFAHAG